MKFIIVIGMYYVLVFSMMNYFLKLLTKNNRV